MLFFFAAIATLLTIINVGVNEAGKSSLSTVSSALAADGITLVAGSNNSSIPPAMSSCAPSCSPSSNSSQKVYPTDETVKGVLHACTSTDASGNCTISGIVEKDRAVNTAYCVWQLRVRGGPTIIGGPQAVQYLKYNAIGTFWNGGNLPERMFRHLTGTELGWGVYPVNWSGIRNQWFNGTTAPQSEGNGAYTWSCPQQFRMDQAYRTRSSVATCAPKWDGRPFPYSTGYYVTYKNTEIFRVGNHQNRDWTIKSETCVYVSKNTPPPKILDQTWRCYWNIQHTGWYTTNRAAINSGGTSTTNAPDVTAVNKGKKPYLTGSNSTADVKDCTLDFSMNAILELKNGHAYYRLQGTANYQMYQYYIWDTSWTGGVKLRADVKALGGVGTEVRKVFGTHRCDVNPAWKQYDSFNLLPVVNFKASDCAKDVLKNYKCVIPHDPRINGVSTNIEVMRDGNYLPINMGGVNISGSGVRDTYSHKMGAVEDKNMSYMVKVLPGSSPLNGPNMNDTKQYFELWKNTKTIETNWNSWISEPNTNKTSYITYYWSSDKGTSWKMTYQAKLNSADFAVKFQDRTNSPTYDKWITETNVPCDTVKTSNAVTVLRSVSSEG